MGDERFRVFEFVPSCDGVATVKAAMKRCGLKQITTSNSGMLAGFYHVEGSGPENAAKAYLTMRWDISDWSKAKPHANGK